VPPRLDPTGRLAENSRSVQIDTVRGESRLGSWTYSAWRPPRLAGIIDHLWHYEGPTSHRRKRVFPNGKVEVILNFAAPYRLLAGAGTELCRVAWVGGPQVEPLVVEQPPRQDAVGVRLRPAGAYALLGRPVREVAGLSVDLADLIGPAAPELAERCDAAATVADRFRIAIGWIVHRLARNRGMDEAVAWAVARIDDSGGTVAIAELRDQTGLSKARLVALFREQVGLAPKVYARVVRFHRALGLLQGGAGRLTDVALDARFYDQPHMNAEFRALGGVTPREFVAARHPVGDGSTASDGPPAR
jgi:AraC-like DNA-binding protein